MQGGAVVQPVTTRRLLFAVMACATLIGTGSYVVAQPGARPPTPPPGATGADDPELLRISRNVAGDPKPIVVRADTITTWVENGRRVLLVQGQVLVEQGVLQARFDQGVLWIDLSRYKREHVLHADLYAEGNVRVQNAAENNTAPRVLADLNTRGELKIHAHKSKVTEQARTDDPFYLRALAEKSGPATPAPIQRTSGQEPAPPGPPASPAPPPGFRSVPAGGTGGQPVQGAPPFSGVPGPVPMAPPPGPSVAPGGGLPPPGGVPPLVVPPPPPSQGFVPPATAPPPGTMTGPPGTAGPPGGGPPEMAPPPRRATGAAAAPAGAAPPRSFSIAPRTAANFQTQIVNVGPGEQALVVTGGVILHVHNVEKIGLLDIEADRLVVWKKGGASQELLSGIQQPEGHSGRELEFYLAGHVILREQDEPPPVPPPGTKPATTGPGPANRSRPGAPDSDQPAVARGQAPAAGDPAPAGATASGEPGGPPAAPKTAPGTEPAAGQRPDAPVAPPRAPRRAPVSRTLRCDEVYYNVSRNVALALNADLEIKQPGFPDPIHFQGVEVQQLSPTQFRGEKAKLFSSKLPSDPGIDTTFAEATLDQTRVVKRGLFGAVVDRKTGQPIMEERDDVVAEGVVFDLEHLPFFYLPWAKFDAHDPLGPLQDFSTGYNSVFGFQVSANLNLYDLLGIDPRPGSRWQLNVDYLSMRGPALGTLYDLSSNEIFGIPARATTLVKTWGIQDDGTDKLGGGRGELEHHPDWRGRFLFRENVQDLPDGFSVQAQVSALSDKNFLEQYYKLEFDSENNQETFLYVKQQPEHENYAWTALAEPRIRNWVTETAWLPRGDFYLIGQPLFDRLVYNAWASAGYAHLETPHVPPPPVDPTDVSVGTGRFDLTQELSLPFYAGPVKMVPYGILDLTYYTADVHDQDLGRVYGGGGLMASIPFTRLYPDVCSDWFNLNALNHKIVLTANYYIAQSSVAFNSLPQLDQLNDNATDQALRDIKPVEPVFNPAQGALLSNSPLYNDQLYAIRRLVDNRIDTLDDIQVLQLDARQRLQTKRGYPGLEHTVDWMTLDVSASVFPDSHRDDFGHTLGFIDYDYLWNIGDRNGFVSNGWFEPYTDGARVFNFGGFYDRIDRTSLYVGYRQIDPVGSRLALASIGAVLSPKYAISLGTAYDFGTAQQSNSLVLTRIGSDLQVSLGFTYNSTTNNFGFLFEIVPNAVAQTRKAGALQAVGPGSGLLGGR
jgi:hypothetical protein